MISRDVANRVRMPRRVGLQHMRALKNRKLYTHFLLNKNHFFGRGYIFILHTVSQKRELIINFSHLLWVFLASNRPIFNLTFTEINILPGSLVVLIENGHFDSFS